MRPPNYGYECNMYVTRCTQGSFSEIGAALSKMFTNWVLGIIGIIKWGYGGSSPISKYLSILHVIDADTN